MAFDNFDNVSENSSNKNSKMFDTFDEGVALGGIRSKNEIRTLICYLFTTINKPLTKDVVLSALLEKGIANYFEASSCFDDLIKAEHIVLKEGNSYTYTDTARLISNQLESTLSTTVKERALECCLSVLEKTRLEEENTVTIEKADNGYNVCCTISGGDMDLMSFKIYVPQIEMARRIRKNFYKNPETIYEVMIAMLSRNKQTVRDTLDKLNSVI